MNAARISLVLLIAIFLAPAASAGSRDFEGIWIGTAELPERAVDEIVLIVEATPFGIAGTISDGLELIRPGTAFAGQCPDGSTLVVSLPTADGLILALTLKAHGDRLTGCWADPDGCTGKIELVRRYAPPEADSPSGLDPVSGSRR
jgi:hypothetical protein